MRHTVGIADVRLSTDAEDELITHALGSCIGVTIHDATVGLGGMIHIMLPLSKIDEAKAQANPSMFVDTGIPELFQRAYTLGAKKENLTVKVAGGAKILDTENRFNIGARNCAMLRKLLWKNQVLIASEDVGGEISRTLVLHVGSGTVTVRSNGTEREL